MNEKFSNAIEARQYFESLQKQIQHISFNADIRLIWANVNAMVDELSIIEVRCRQKKNWNAADKYRAELQEYYNLIQKYIIMLTLMEQKGR